MKIGIVCPYNIYKPGGVQEHVMYQAEVLRARGHKVTILTPRPRGHEDEHIPKGVVFLGGSARIKTPAATSSDVSVTIDVDALDEELAKGYDVIHVHEPAMPLLARQMLPRVDCLRVGTFHAALPGNALGRSLIRSYRAYFKTVVPYIDVITAVSPAAIGFIQGVVDEDKITYIPNGIALKKMKPKDDKIRNKNQIFFIGRLEKRKGALYTIKAFEILKKRNPNLELIIGGDGPLRDSLENYVERNSISDVTFKGFLSDEEKAHYMSTCGVYTSPALYGESFGIVLAEAMAFGAPTVAHKNEGYEWVLQGTGRLSLVDVHDITAYADRLQLMLEDDELRFAWQKWASQYVKQFDYEKVVDQYEALYKSHM
ncbi:MAG TPA: glycosyltransferase family 4 protein [Candidatus Saccharibacteria bacterium]|jgi:phosphatidylinositol alpha-mannosyltransferase|nr:glycosyltransferase family 4 protein [Candidatus Saccharibacteria bacterium]HMT55356.1 glycosyltransferase family 4 protein [Candidatus Saccharibacteria bacterium]